MNIHYHKVTGKIMMYDLHHEPIAQSHWPDHLVAFLDPPVTINANVQKIDVRTRKLIETESDQPLIADHDINEAVAIELFHTDAYVVPDRPMSAEKRAAWQTYRQALRDLSKLATPVQMVKAWPMRPDGADAVVNLRARCRPRKIK